MACHVKDAAMQVAVVVLISICNRLEIVNDVTSGALWNEIGLEIQVKMHASQVTYLIFLC